MVGQSSSEMSFCLALHLLDQNESTSALSPDARLELIQRVRKLLDNDGMEGGVSCG
jgi:hypothetical protein